MKQILLVAALLFCVSGLRAEETDVPSIVLVKQHCDPKVAKCTKSGKRKVDTKAKKISVAPKKPVRVRGAEIAPKPTHPEIREQTVPILREQKLSSNQLAPCLYMLNVKTKKKLITSGAS